MGPCDLDMAYAQVADGGEGLQTCRLGQVTKGDPPAWGLGKGLTIFQPKHLICYEI